MQNKKVEKIFVVFKTHFDIGFTALPSEIKEKYTGEMVPDAVDTCIKSKQLDPEHPYVWTMPSWPLTYVLDRDSSGLDSLVKEKQIVWHALPFTTHTEFCGLEEFIRGMYTSKRLSEKYGYAPVSAKMTDVPGHTWILPSLLNKAGIKFLHLGCNPCSTPPDVPSLFYWEGPDGSRVLTYYSKGDYGSGVFPPEEWDLPIWLAMMSTGDNHGAHGPEVIKNILEEVGEKSPDTEVRFGTLDDFYEELKKQELDLPVIKKDLADCWIHGVGTYPQKVSEIRALRNRLTAVEAAMALEGIYGNETLPDCGKYIREAYENMLLFGEHTWGMDTKLALNTEEFGGRVYGKKQFKEIKGQGKFNRIQESWQEKSGYVDKAADCVDRLQKAVLGEFPEGSSAAGMKYIKVYNTQSVKRDGLIEADPALGAKSVLLDQESNEISGAVVLDGKTCFAVKDIPALSYKVFKIIDASGQTAGQNADTGRQLAYETQETLNLENESIKLEVEKTSGRILSLINKATGKNWVNSGSQQDFGQYVYDIYSKREVFEYVRDYAFDLQDWYLADFGKPLYPLNMKHHTYTHGFTGAQLENTGAYGSITVKYAIAGESLEEFGNAGTVILRLTLWKDGEGVDLEYDIKNKQETPCPEAGHFVFPLNAAAPSYRINKSGSVIDPSEDIMKDCNHVLYCCEKWVDVTDKDRAGNDEGILFIPYDTPLLSIGEKGIERYSKDYVPTSPDVYFNAFNNQWGTNFPQWIGGDFSFRYRLIPHSGNWQDINANKKANGALTPLPAAYLKEVKDSDNRTAGLLATDIDSVEITALKCAEDQKGYILRIRETGGVGRKRSVVFVNAVRNVFECDILENNIASRPLVPAENGKALELELKPYDIVTLRLIV